MMTRHRLRSFAMTSTLASSWLWRLGLLLCGLLVAFTAAPAAGFEVDLEPVASGLCSPVSLTHAGDGSGRRFIVDQCGTIRIVDASGTLLAAPFLDVTAKMVSLAVGFDERGLLGVAFHPSYASNGRFFVRYSAPRTGVFGEPCFGTPRGCHKAVLAEYSVSGSDPNLADPGSEIVLFEVDEPEFNHNGGDVSFGPDGFLYFALGDGGGANDDLDQPGTPHGPLGNGQDNTTLLGAMLRIDVDSAPDPGLAYAIPPSNPFVAVAGADEIYAFGLRNPYRFSFDDGPGGNGALYLADVGQNLFEELDVVVSAGNYGWATREGLHCFDPFNPGVPPASCSTTGPSGEPLLDPVLEYDHGVGISIIGGFVYRGTGVPGLPGKYVFGDFSSVFGVPDGRLLVTDVSGANSFVRDDLTLVSGQPLGRYLKGFGRDEDGELYVLGSTALAPTGATGEALRITAVGSVPALPFWAALTGVALLVLAVWRRSREGCSRVPR